MPQLTSRELVRFLRRQGFEDDRQTGSHLTLWHPAKRISVTIPMHQGRDLGRGIAISILDDAGFTVDEYLRLR